MTHKKIIKRENGDTVRIEVKFFDFGLREYHHGNKFRYDVEVELKAKGKTNWHYDSFFATPEEIHAAKMELWEQLKPIK